tara:strand:+ start:1820 stop:1924 length:105 start_codon:yes stop_codon:yes gene_type:complete
LKKFIRNPKFKEEPIEEDVSEEQEETEKNQEGGE